MTADEAASIPATGLSETERLEIVKAIGLPKGHWYKCPNGHTYAIGGRGGAMQRAKCPEYKVEIGGMSHALAAGNVHACTGNGQLKTCCMVRSS